MLDERLVFLGAAVSFCGGLSYLKATLRGDVRPNRVTWLLWGLIPMIAFAASVHEGVGLPALMTFMVGFNPILIFIASLINGQGHWRLTEADIACGFMSMAGIGLWVASKEATQVIVFMIAADVIAGVPTLVKSYKDPERERYHVYFLGSVNAAITLLVISTWEFAYYAFPVYMLVLGTTLTILIRFNIGPRIRSTSRDSPKGERDSPKGNGVQPCQDSR